MLTKYNQLLSVASDSLCKIMKSSYQEISNLLLFLNRSTGPFYVDDFYELQDIFTIKKRIQMKFFVILIRKH